MGKTPLTSDDVLDWAAENVNAARRDRAMERTHNAGGTACECCGLALKTGHITVDGIPVGPECLKKLKKAGLC